MRQSVIFLIEKHPGWIRFIPEERQVEYELYHDELIAAEKDAEKQWRSVDSAEARKAIEEWKQDPKMQEFAKAARVRYLKGKIRETLGMFRDNKEAYVDARRRGDFDTAKELMAEAEGLERRLKGYERSLAVLEGRGRDEITPEMVERAREYPIDRLVEADARGFARCVNHEEKTPSMFTKRNFAHCFGCQWHGDAIDLYRKISGATFPEAVKFLSGQV
jgi:hypothetical protein